MAMADSQVEFSAIPACRRIGLHGRYAGITVPNDASVRLHEALGFRKVGYYEEVGWKFGQYRSVAWYEIRIQE